MADDHPHPSGACAWGFHAAYHSSIAKRVRRPFGRGPCRRHDGLCHDAAGDEGAFESRAGGHSLPGRRQEGVASWYGPGFHGKLTSNGEVYDMHATTAAHKTLPFNTRVRVVNLDNQRETEVRINDRGPFAGNRIIDLSYQAAKELGMIKSGIAPVRLVVTQRPGSGLCMPS